MRTIAMDTLAYTIAEACTVTRTGKTALYEAINTGELRAVKRGRRTLVLPADLKEWIEKLPPSSASGNSVGLADETRSERGGAQPRQCGRGCISATRPNASPRPAATGSRAKRKDHLNAADNTRSEEQPQSETRWLAPVGALEAVDSHLKWSGRRGSHSEEPE